MCEVGRRCNGYLSRQAQAAKGKYEQAQRAETEAVMNVLLSSQDRQDSPAVQAVQVKAAVAAEHTRAAQGKLWSARVDLYLSGPKGQDQLYTERDQLREQVVEGHLAGQGSHERTAAELDDLEQAIRAGEALTADDAPQPART